MVTGWWLVVVCALGVAAGAGLVVRGLSPTGATVPDAVVLVAAATFVVWAGASAPWWALAASAGAAGVLSGGWVPALAGGGLFLLALRVGTRHRRQRLERAAVASGSLLVWSSAAPLGWWGVSTAVAMIMCALVAVTGLYRRPRRDRRAAWVLAAITAGLAAVGTLTAFVGAAAARAEVERGVRDARDGLELLADGDHDAALAAFERSARALDAGQRAVGAWYTAPASWVPVLAQHHRVADQLTRAAAQAAGVAADQLSAVRFEALTVVDSRVDLGAVSQLGASLRQVQATLDQLSEVLAGLRNGWLVTPLERRLDELQRELDDQRLRSTDVAAAVDVAPALLGAQGPRVYLVMFTTPAEARGQGGFMGNWAEVTADAGRLTMTAFGRTGQLGVAEGFTLAGPGDFLDRYANDGFRIGPDGVVVDQAWSNITISPHFPSTATVAAALYQSHTGTTLDGVISVDVQALATVVGFTGPVAVPDTEIVLDGDTTAPFLLSGQYELSDADRRDALEAVALDVVARLLGGGVDDPLAFLRALAPDAAEGRVLLWSRHGAEQQVFATTGLDGRVFRRVPAGDQQPALDVSLRAVNANPSKIDVFLERSVCVRPGDDVVAFEVTLGNAAPAGGLSPVVLGNGFGLPSGTNRSLVSLYSETPVRAVRVNGTVAPASVQVEAGAYVATVRVEVPPQGSLLVEFDVVRPSGVDAVRAWPQPLVRPERWGVAAAGGGCEPEAAGAVWLGPW